MEAPLARSKEQAWSVHVTIRMAILRAFCLHTTTACDTRLGPGLQNSPGGRDQPTSRDGPPISAGLAVPRAL